MQIQDGCCGPWYGVVLYTGNYFLGNKIPLSKTSLSNHLTKLRLKASILMRLKQPHKKITIKYYLTYLTSQNKMGLMTSNGQWMSEKQAFLTWTQALVWKLLHNSVQKEDWLATWTFCSNLVRIPIPPPAMNQEHLFWSDLKCINVLRESNQKAT